jgi:hypothetical protein
MTYILYSGDWIDISWNPEFEKYDVAFIHFETQRQEYIVKGIRNSIMNWKVPFSGHFNILIAESGTTNWKKSDFRIYGYMKPPRGISFDD